MPAIGRGTKPKSLVEQLTAQAPVRPVNHSLSVDRYLISAKLALDQANQYRRVGDEEQLYVILLRFASLVVETIPKHPGFSGVSPEYVRFKTDLVQRYLPELERLKASLHLKDRPEPPALASRSRPSDAVQLSAADLPQLPWGAAEGAAAGPSAARPTAAVGADRQSGLQVDDLLEVMRGSPPTVRGGLSVFAAQQQQQPQQAVGQPGQGPGVGAGSSGTLAALAAGPTDPYALAAAATAATSAPPGLPELKYSVNYAASSSGRHALFGAPSSSSAQSGSAPLGGRGMGSALPRYPSLEVGPVVQQQQQQPQQQPGGVGDAMDLAALSLTAGYEQMALPHPSAGPALGPQEVGVQYISSTDGLSVTCIHAPVPPPPPPGPSTPTAASAAGGPKELVKRAQLRDVHISMALMKEFLEFAKHNTSRGIESCGILAGKLLAGDNAFSITALIIPKQQGTTDTVQALNEEEIFEVQFERELYPLGWIHTHPSQTCFLSSVDVHTQCGYQTMLDEAVAIVMAPTDSKRRCGIFRLSTPGGLGLIQKCPDRGFHAHPPTPTGQELYELCGHVYTSESVRHEVLDLRDR